VAHELIEQPIFADADGNIAYFHGNFFRSAILNRLDQPVDGSDPPRTGRPALCGTTPLL